MFLRALTGIIQKVNRFPTLRRFHSAGIIAGQSSKAKEALRWIHGSDADFINYEIENIQKSLKEKAENKITLSSLLEKSIFKKGLFPGSNAFNLIYAQPTVSYEPKGPSAILKIIKNIFKTS